MAYRYCMALVEVNNDQGDREVGAAFHIGDGYYITARHVAEHEIFNFWPYDEPEPGLRDAMGLAAIQVKRILSQPDVDLALLDTGHVPRLPHYAPGLKRHHETEVSIGGHLDDWLDEGMTLFDVVVMGYPPIPQAGRPVLVATGGHINAVIDKYGGGHPHFIVSAIPRGGFSGGPVIYQDWLVGVVTESLVRDGAPPELGYAAALSVEPLWDLLHRHGIYPGSNGDFLRAVYDGDEEASKRLLGPGHVRFSRRLRIRAPLGLLWIRASAARLIERMFDRQGDQ